MKKKSLLAGLLLTSMALTTVFPVTTLAQQNTGTIVEQGEVTGELVEKDGKTYVSVSAKQAIGYISIHGVSASGKSFSVKGDSLAAGETGLYEVTIPEAAVRTLPKTSSVRESIVFEGKAKKEVFTITVSYDIERAGVAVVAPVGDIITPEETAAANPAPSQPEAAAQPATEQPQVEQPVANTEQPATETATTPSTAEQPVATPVAPTPAPTPVATPAPAVVPAPAPAPVVAPFSYGSRQVSPIYQNVEPWSGLWYGSSTLGYTGCVPAALAMSFNAYGSNLSIINVSDYLIGTGTFNTATYQGTTAQGISLAAQYYGYKTTVLHTKEDITQALKSGGVVISLVGSLHHGGSTTFTTAGYTHAVVLQGYQNGYTTVYNPLVTYGVNTYSLDTILNERSDDPQDNLLGSPFILIHK